MNILEKIISNKKKEIAALREQITVRDLENSRMFTRATLSLSEFILDPSRSGIIAEFKRKSPSGSIINSGAKLEEVTKGYARAGASGLSILTDRQFFGGDCSDLIRAREHNNIPIIRKEFIIDEIQVIESKAAGADAILLIAAVLEKKEILKLAMLSRSMDMEVLFEIHSPDELNKLNEYVNIIGVNNRDLGTMKTSYLISMELADKIPGEFIRISESGISTLKMITELRNAGYDGFLIGEYFMGKPDPVKAFTDFVNIIS